MNGKMTSAIECLTLTSATYDGCAIKPTYINFFFGNNGVGKTTIAKAIKSSDGVSYMTGKSAADYSILVYNQDFITSNIQRYDNLPGVFTMDEQNIEIQNEIAEKKAEKDKLDNKNIQLNADKGKKTEALNSLQITLQTDCWDKAKTLREGFPKTQDGYKRKQQFTDRVLEIKNPQQHDLDALQILYDTAFDPNARTYNLFSAITDTSILDTMSGIELLSKTITSSSDTPFAEFIKAINATDWVRQGHEHFTATPDGKCPYCQQELPKDFESQITCCFDAQYQADVATLNALLIAYKSKANELFPLLQGNITDPYPKLSLQGYTDKLALLKSTIQSNIQKITMKISEPGTAVDIDDTTSILNEINKLISDYNKKIGDNNSVVNAKQKNKAECTTKIWELIAFTLQSEVASYKTSKKGIADAISDINKQIADCSTKSAALGTAMAALNSKVVNTKATVDSINILLKDSGFQGFSLREKASMKNVYEVIRFNGAVATNLSEGECNFIAFLYFYHLVKGSATEDGGVQDKIVVIDDPVSSMDSNSLFIVSSLVREMISICHNNVDYKEISVQGNYIKQIFILTHNAYFHREITCNQEKHYRYVSFFLITKNDNVSTIRQCERPNHKKPSELENYNPVQNSYAALWAEYRDLTTTIPLLNVIRRILEYYFIQLCGYEGTSLRETILKDHKDKFVKYDETGKEDTILYQIASSMLSYISANSFGMNDGLNYVDNCMDVIQCRETFEMIFTYMEQAQHYKMMMGMDE